MTPYPEYYTQVLEPIHGQLLQHPTVQKHLSAKDIRHQGDVLMPDEILGIDTLDLSLIEFTHLFCAFNGSRFTTQARKMDRLHAPPPGVEVCVIHNRLIAREHKGKNRLIVARGTNEVVTPSVLSSSVDKSGNFYYYLHIDWFFLDKDALEGLGTLSLALCAIQAFVSGLRRIELFAAGGRDLPSGRNVPKRLVGYKVWPKLGFDASLSSDEIAALPEHLQGCTTVSHIVAIDDGYWTKHGSQRIMSFDLRAGSKSWATLLAYLHRKGLAGEAHG